MEGDTIFLGKKFVVQEYSDTLAIADKVHPELDGMEVAGSPPRAVVVDGLQLVIVVAQQLEGFQMEDLSFFCLSLRERTSGENSEVHLRL